LHQHSTIQKYIIAQQLSNWNRFLQISTFSFDNRSQEQLTKMVLVIYKKYYKNICKILDKYFVEWYHIDNGGVELWL